MTPREYGHLWAMTPEQVRAALRAGEIAGARDDRGLWVIPDDAPPPATPEQVRAALRASEIAGEHDDRGLGAISDDAPPPATPPGEEKKKRQPTLILGTDTTLERASPPTLPGLVIMVTLVSVLSAIWYLVSAPGYRRSSLTRRSSPSGPSCWSRS